MKVQNQPVTIANGKGREEQLQFLRFLAFLNVFVTHAEQWLFFPYRATFSALASVSFFFMLSGLVAGYSLAGKTVVPSFGNIAGFLWKKIRKVTLCWKPWPWAWNSIAATEKGRTEAIALSGRVRTL